jgi:hypothetical protein
MQADRQTCQSLDFICKIMKSIEKEKSNLDCLEHKAPELYASMVTKLMPPLTVMLQDWRDSPHVCQACKLRFDTLLVHKQAEFVRINNDKEIWQEDKPFYLLWSVNNLKQLMNEFEERY